MLKNRFDITCLANEPAGIAAEMTGIATLDVYAADPVAKTEAKGPEWIKILPRGKFIARDGRPFDIDPELLVSRFEADAIDIPVDLDHATVKKALFGDAAPAVGWINKLEARTDGLYGRVEWLDEGLRVLAARTHRYISPSMTTDDNGKALWLHSAALVAAPAASMPAVASAQPKHSPEKPMLKAIALALGLTEDASEASCLSALGDLKKRVDPAIHEQTLQTLSTTKTALETLRAETRKGKIDGLLEEALKAKKIVPAERDTFAALCATDEGIEQVKKLIELRPATLGATNLDTKSPTGDVKTLSAEDRQIMKELGLTEEEFRKANGLTAA